MEIVLDLYLMIYVAVRKIELKIQRECKLVNF